MRPLHRSIPAIMIAGLAALTTGCQPYQPVGTLLDPPVPLEDFALPDVEGGTFRLSDQAGRLVLIFFGYTTCPDICPATLAQVARAVDQLGSDADQVRVVFVSVDPQRDTPEQIRAYLDAFNDTFVGLRTTDLAVLDGVLQQFGAFYTIDPVEGESGYTVTHTSALFVVDPEGQLREVISFGATADQIAADVRYLLKQR